MNLYPRETNLICFFSSKLIGSSRIDRIRSCVDRATSSLTRFCSSATQEMTRQVCHVIYTCYHPEGLSGVTAYSHRNNLTPVTVSHRPPSRSWWRPLWKPDVQDLCWETHSSLSSLAPSISLSWCLDGQRRQEFVFAFWQGLSQIYPSCLIF